MALIRKDILNILRFTFSMIAVWVLAGWLLVFFRTFGIEEQTEGVVDWTAFIAEIPKSYDLGYSAGEANDASIPLGLIWGILGLLAFKSYFGFIVFLGAISLVGIAINNAIELIDRIKIKEEEFNRKPFNTIIAASLQRFRPILLTTFTTTLGLILLYRGGKLIVETYGYCDHDLFALCHSHKAAAYSFDVKVII